MIFSLAKVNNSLSELMQSSYFSICDDFSILKYQRGYGALIIIALGSQYCTTNRFTTFRESFGAPIKLVFEIQSFQN